MLKISAKKLAQVVGGRLVGKDSEVIGIEIDTRKLSGSEVFFALKGENSDGHNYINSQIKAEAVVVSKEADFPTQIIVKDTLKALGDLARYYREQFQPTIIGITGSNGKTTTKEMLAAILKTHQPTLYTKANYNNEIGLPLTLFQLNKEHRYVVLEMGMRGLGQIQYLADIAKPSVGIVTYIGEVHAELLGSIDNIAKAKGELLSSLPQDGLGVIPTDKDYYNYLSSLTENILSFGVGGDVYAKEISFDKWNKASFLLCYQDKTVPISLSLPGEHNINNALAAATVALYLGIPLENIKAALEGEIAIKQRLVEIEKGDGNLIVIDDTYNASPSSVKEALKHLATRAKALGVKSYAALGDMKELGKNSKKYHYEIGNIAAELDIDALFLLGEEMAMAQIAAKEHGLQAQICSSHQEIAAKVQDLKGILLLKGSRSMAMEKVLDYLN